MEWSWICTARRRIVDVDHAVMVVDVEHVVVVVEIEGVSTEGEMSLPLNAGLFTWKLPTPQAPQDEGDGKGDQRDTPPRKKHFCSKRTFKYASSLFQNLGIAVELAHFLSLHFHQAPLHCVDQHLEKDNVANMYSLIHIQSKVYVPSSSLER